MNIFFGFLATLFCFTALKEFGAVDANGASRKYLQKEKRGVTAEEEQGVEEVVQDMKVLAQEATGHESSDKRGWDSFSGYLGNNILGAVGKRRYKKHTDKRPGGLVGLLKRGADTSMFRYRKSQVEEGEEEEEKRIPESPLVAKRSEVETKRPGGLVGLLKRSPDLEMEDKRSGGLIGLLKRSALDKRPAPKGKTRQPMKRAAPKGKTRQPMKRAAPKGKTRQPMKRAAPKGKTRQPMKRAAPKGKTRQPMKKFDPGFAGKRSPHERVTAEEPITKML